MTTIFSSQTSKEDLQPLQDGAEKLLVTLTLAELAERSKISAEDIQGLVEYGVLSPIKPEAQSLEFNLACLSALQRAEHLREDLILDNHSFALAVMLENQIVGLEAQLFNLQLQLRQFQTTSAADLPNN